MLCIVFVERGFKDVSPVCGDMYLLLLWFFLLHCVCVFVFFPFLSFYFELHTVQFSLCHILCFVLKNKQNYCQKDFQHVAK